ncbi:YkvA family protein [Halopseudomonas sp.]|uniref:YkvA family protein n=1 Tax=Halopseudomonas sp. TaxID=2901191 RepID=UPI003002FC30
MEHHFSEKAFWQKLAQHARAAGREVVEKALWLYYAARRPETPGWAKAVILSVLAYFIAPIDAMPDFTPFVGFTDDLGVFAGALAMVSMYIDDEVKGKATATAERWFGRAEVADPAI